MIGAGWQREVQEIKRACLTHHIRRMRPLGYDVWLDEPDPEIAEQKIAQLTQAYAKRQMTWFRNQLPGVPMFAPDVEEPGRALALFESLF
jgi:tRNA dimethylallyltransferase